MTILDHTAGLDRHAEAFQGARCVDTTSNPRIPTIMQMVGDLSRARAPQEVLRSYAEGVAKLSGRRMYISLSTRGLGPGEYRITRKIMSEREWDAAMNSDPWRDAGQMPVQRGGLLGEIIRSAYPELIHHLYLRGDPVLGDDLVEVGSLMAIPLFDDGLPQNWAIMLHPDAEGFSLENLEEAILRGNLVGGTIKNTLVSKQLREANQRIDSEVQHVARIQRALLPPEFPQVSGVTFAAGYETYGTAGGDLYDVVRLGPSRADSPLRAPTDSLALLIADASGHGPAAAVVVAMLNAILYAYPGGEGGPAEVLRFANQHLYRKKLEGMFVTAILAAYDLATRRLYYARAGHNPALVKHAGSGGAVERLDAVGGVPLGVLPDVEFENGVVEMADGLTLVMYTDGIPDARNPQGRQFGVEGIMAALEQCTGEAACVVQSIQSAVCAHEAGTAPVDDQTLLAMRVG